MTKLTFEEIDTSQGGIGTVPNGYGRIDWQNFYAVPGDEFPGSGFERGTTSGKQVALNGTGDTAILSVEHGVFSLKSVEMTAAWDLKLKVQIDGYSGADHAFHRVVTISDHGPKLVQLDFTGVDYVVFYPIPGSGIHDPDQTGSGNVIAFDDMRITDVHRHSAAAVDALLPPPTDHHHLAGHLALA